MKRFRREKLSFLRRVYSHCRIIFKEKNVNLNVKKGEIKAIIGVNGSGKSTLIELICNVKKFDSGSIKIDGSLTLGLKL